MPRRSGLPEGNDPGFLAGHSHRVAKAVVERPRGGDRSHQKLWFELVGREHGDPADAPHAFEQRLVQHDVAHPPEIDALVPFAEDAALDLQPLRSEGVSDGPAHGERREQVERPEDERGGDRSGEEGGQRAVVPGRRHGDGAAGAEAGAPQAQAGVGAEGGERLGSALWRDESKLRRHDRESTIGRWNRSRAASTTATRSRSPRPMVDRKSTRLNSSHSQISYAVFCLKKKKKNRQEI